MFMSYKTDDSIQLKVHTLYNINFNTGAGNYCKASCTSGCLPDNQHFIGTIQLLNHTQLEGLLT